MYHIVSSVEHAPDKGNEVVLMNKDEYISKVKEVLNDTSKFQPIREDLLLKILNKEEQINRFLRKLKGNGTITENEYNQLYVSGSRPGIMYGLPKVHKNGYSIRPIMSAIG